jgi:hypothetical protein
MCVNLWDPHCTWEDIAYSSASQTRCSLMKYTKSSKDSYDSSEVA